VSQINDRRRLYERNSYRKKSAMTFGRNGCTVIRDLFAGTELRIAKTCPLPLSKSVALSIDSACGLVHGPIAERTMQLVLIIRAKMTDCSGGRYSVILASVRRRYIRSLPRASRKDHLRRSGIADVVAPSASGSWLIMMHAMHARVPTR
jgi:hypothetical protein